MLGQALAERDGAAWSGSGRGGVGEERKRLGAVSFLVVVLIDHLLTPYIPSFPIRLLADAALVIGGSIVLAIIVVLGQTWASRRGGTDRRRSG